MGNRLWSTLPLTGGHGGGGATEECVLISEFDETGDMELEKGFDGGGGGGGGGGFDSLKFKVVELAEALESLILDERGESHNEWKDSLSSSNF